MIRFKEFLAFPMFATAIWLLWILNRQVGSTGLAVALSVCLGLVFLLWLLPLLGPWLRRVAGVAGIAALIALSLQIQTVQPERGWIVWSADAVAEARASGKAGAGGFLGGLVRHLPRQRTCCLGRLRPSPRVCNRTAS